MDYLNEAGRIIYARLEKHCQQNMKEMPIDSLELGMLANSFALYAECAVVCNTIGVKMSFTNDKGGAYEQVRPEYTVMKNEYANVLKHSAKFGLNPGDRDKIFKHLSNAKKPKKDFTKKQ